MEMPGVPAAVYLVLQVTTVNPCGEDGVWVVSALSKMAVCVCMCIRKETPPVADVELLLHAILRVLT